MRYAQNYSKFFQNIRSFRYSEKDILPIAFALSLGGFLFNCGALYELHQHNNLSDPISHALEQVQEAVSKTGLDSILSKHIFD